MIGPAAIRAGFTEAQTKQKFAKQFIGTHTVEVHGDTATGQAYLEARYATLDGQSLMVAGVYHDTYRRTPQG